MSITLDEFVQELSASIPNANVEVDKKTKELIDEGCPYTPAYKLFLYFELDGSTYGEYFEVSSWLLSHVDSVKHEAVKNLIQLIKSDWDYIRSSVLKRHGKELAP